MLGFRTRWENLGHLFSAQSLFLLCFSDVSCQKHLRSVLSSSLSFEDISEGAFRALKP